MDIADNNRCFQLLSDGIKINDVTRMTGKLINLDSHPGLDPGEILFRLEFGLLLSLEQELKLYQEEAILLSTMMNLGGWSN